MSFFVQKILPIRVEATVPANFVRQELLITKQELNSNGQIVQNDQ